MNIEPCNNTSVGILVRHDSKLLLIERANKPYGWAPPAGHVDLGETYEQAAARELWEETRLRATSLRQVLVATYHNQCRRPGGDFHRWEVFEGYVTGELHRSETETRAARWVSQNELSALAAITRSHMASNSCVAQWQSKPGLEPVWLTMLRELGQVV